MRTLSIMAFASFLVLWGVYSYLMDDTVPVETTSIEVQTTGKKKPTKSEEPETLLTHKKRRELDKIGSVINEDNADIDYETRNQIKVAKKVYDNDQNLKDKQALLEQSYMDKSSSIKDIKRLQDVIIELKNKMKKEVANTERWDPKFVYYLMIQENYTYAEINQIKSLSENGLNAEEINYITELVKEDAFKERISAFKTQGDSGRAIASLKKKPKEKDDFIEDPTIGQASMESKLIEMNYNQEEREEMVYGNSQQ
ncbi:MAG: hypothetical protein ACXVCE_02015 [Bacteriovorax sp.]